MLAVFLFASAAEAQKTGTKRSVSDGDISAGLKEALGKGVRSAIASLGKEDGFLANPRVRIPLPLKT